MARLWVLDRDLPPDVFEIVMATGIVSVAANDHHYRILRDVQAVLATAIFVALAAALAAQVMVRRRAIIAETRDPDSVLRMFTFVAGSSVLAVVWVERPIALWILSGLAIVGWLVLVPMAIRDVLSRPGSELRDHASGAWLLASVATAGMAITAADLGVVTDWWPLMLAGVVFWFGGLVAYGAVMWLIAWRVVVARLRPEYLTPDSWIVMGALAIGTLAGTHLLRAADVSDAGWLTAWLGPATLVVWAVASLWIPVLLCAEMWRIVRRAEAWRFSAVWWSAVFPMGMYSSATAEVGHRFGLSQLGTLSLVFCWIAIVMWTLVTVAMVHSGMARRGRST